MTKYFKIVSLFVVLQLHAESIIIDGDLSEPEWEKAIVIDRFYEVSPYTLKAVSYTHLTLPTKA